MKITVENVNDPVTDILLSDSVINEFVLRLSDVNEPPALSLANRVSELAENDNTLTRRKVADFVVSDGKLGTNVISWTGPDRGTPTL